MTKGDITHIIREQKLNLQKFTVEYFKKQDGSCQAKEFLNSLDEKMQAKLFRLLYLLEQNGNELREPYSKALTDGIFELRGQQGNNIARVLYFFVVGQQIIITHGFVKKTQKTPKSEIKLAKKYRQEYLERVGE